ncbi:hypothetical protein ABAC460_08945 [Asticcacaulis sp. AC460]|uniref:hypothetical protein n=1 Tax=Asticcacaulis sp. AC460 TaxID=1282360 RepID=UPI0003C40216|nr:hypothetical protein [Asticcacaulis sp. AC460]ESQ90604.1 hypothetical protein ABAC460_08945 [Asticcacaulis sp. AC460]
MGNAVWLMLALPTWFFGQAWQGLSRLDAQLLLLVPAIGVIALVVGCLAAAVLRKVGALWFLVPVLACELFVGVAGLMRGKLSGPQAIWIGFLVVQLMVSAYLAFRLKPLKAKIWVGVPLIAFCMSFALEAAFIAAMAFPDTWV